MKELDFLAKQTKQNKVAMHFSLVWSIFLYSRERLLAFFFFYLVSGGLRKSGSIFCLLCFICHRMSTTLKGIYISGIYIRSHQKLNHRPKAPMECTPDNSMAGEFRKSLQRGGSSHMHTT